MIIISSVEPVLPYELSDFSGGPGPPDQTGGMYCQVVAPHGSLSLSATSVITWGGDHSTEDSELLV
jgi:hypothetical protein